MPVVSQSPVAAALADRIRDGARTPEELVVALGWVTEETPVFRSDWPERRPTVIAELEELAAPMLERWRQPCDPASQIELIERDNEPGKPFDPSWDVSAQRWGVWWSFPTADDSMGVGVRATPGPYFGAPCVAAWGVEDATWDSPWLPAIDGVVSTPATLRTRPIQVPDAPRVFEVTGPQDWAELTERFGAQARMASWDEWLLGRYVKRERDRARFAVIDWRQVYDRYDAVHVTQWGYVTTAYAPIQTSLGLTTLAGWGPDVTLWLRLG